MKFEICEGVAAYVVGTIISVLYLMMACDSFIQARKIKNKDKTVVIFRILASASAMLIVPSEMLVYGSLQGNLLPELSLSAAVALFFQDDRCAGQMRTPSVALSVMLILISAGLSLLRFAFGPDAQWLVEFSDWTPAALALSTIVHCAFKVKYLVMDFRPLFRNISVTACVSDHLAYLYTLGFMSLMLLSMVSFLLNGIWSSLLALICLSVIIMVHALACMRSARRRLSVFFPDFEDRFREKTRMTLSTDEDRQKADEGYRTTYERLNALFEEEKPFLNGNLTIGDIAKSLYTNKLYISKSISLCSGRNFCQYVNYHRVRYSIELFRDDPHLKVSELAERSGFHSAASYNMAFRLFMNESPSEWCRRNCFMSDE